MDYYHIWCDLQSGKEDLAFSRAVQRYLGHLADQRLISGYRLTRRKLGFGPEELGEFHLIIETQNLVQLESAFAQVAKRSGETENLHRDVFEKVSRVRFGLYRDFPDPGREQGE